MENFDKLFYDSKTGDIKWAVGVIGTNRRGGLTGGAKSGNGYFRVRYEKKLYLAHRLAWRLFYGKWPSGQIDHINGDRCDNRIKNLRDVSHTTNLQNQRMASKNNSIGLLGVSWSKSNKMWTAQIKINYKKIHLGSFKDPYVAHEAYLTAKRQLHKGCTI